MDFCDFLYVLFQNIQLLNPQDGNFDKDEKPQPFFSISFLYMEERTNERNRFPLSRPNSPLFEFVSPDPSFDTPICAVIGNTYPYAPTPNIMTKLRMEHVKSWTPDEHTSRYASSYERTAPNVQDSNAFPALGDGRGTQRPAVSSGVAWHPSIMPLYTSSSAAAVVAPPPRSFEAQPEEFPSLGNVATLARVTAANSLPKDRDELIARNKALMAALSHAARVGGNADALTTFRTLSQAFQKGEITSMTYFSGFRELFGEAVTAAHFPELVLLLPDQLKREELVRIYDAFDRSRPLHYVSLS